MITHLLAGVDRAMTSSSYSGDDQDHTRSQRPPSSSQKALQPQPQQDARLILDKEERLLLVDLTRLLHCMKTNEAPVPSGSWQSLVLRAQLAQDVWRQIVNADTALSCRRSQRNPQVYRQLAQQVDDACRRAQEMARQLQRQEEEEAEAQDVGMKHVSVAQRVERLFFQAPSSATTQQQHVHEEEDEDDDNTKEENEEYDQDFMEDSDDDDDEAGYSTNRQDDNDETTDHDHSSSPSHHHSRRRRRRPSNRSSLTTSNPGDTTTTTTTTNTNNTSDATNNQKMMEELQQAQREQMEEAIAAMVSQMKTATQHIHLQIKQQTNVVLEEMETVAEQNVQDVTQVLQNVTQHNRTRWKQNFGTWTLFFTIVALFLFCLAIVFTIPKRRDACLFSCPSTTTTTTTTAATTAAKNAKLQQKWDQLFEENELERQEKERLAKLLQAMQQGHVVSPPLPSDNNDNQGTLDDAAAHQHDLESSSSGKDPKGEEEGTSAPPVQQGSEKEYDGMDYDDDHNDAANDDSAMLQPIDQVNIDNHGDSRPDKETLETVESMHQQDQSMEEHRRQQHLVDTRGGEGDAESMVVEDPESNKDHSEHPPQQQPTEPVEDTATTDAERDQIRDALLESIRQKMKEEQEKTENDAWDLHQQQEQYPNSLPQLETMKRRSQIDVGAATDPFELMTAHNVIPPPISNQIANDAFSRRSLARAHFSPRDLRLAASNGDLALVNRYILSKPEYLDRKDKKGWSALHMAVKGGHLPVVVYLLEAGAEFNVVTKDNKLALSIAVERWGEDHAIPNLLRSAGAKLPHEAQEEGGYDSYIEEGRSRLDRLLGSFDDDDNIGGRDEL